MDANFVEKVREVRRRTGCSMALCAQALNAMNGDAVCAYEYVRLKTLGFGRWRLDDGGKLVPGWLEEDYVREAIKAADRKSKLCINNGAEKGKGF